MTSRPRPTARDLARTGPRRSEQNALRLRRPRAPLGGAVGAWRGELSNANITKFLSWRGGRKGY